jgi:hypothetical protein
MRRQQLKDRWRDLFKAAPPAAFTPDLLARGIAWRMQEKALGGLCADARQVIGVSETEQGISARPRTKSGPSLRPGNRLVRRWRGRTYVVEVREGGLVYDGESFSSLSVIAGKITGTRWSGPKFFGVVS